MLDLMQTWDLFGDQHNIKRNKMMQQGWKMRSIKKLRRQDFGSEKAICLSPGVEPGAGRSAHPTASKTILRVHQIGKCG
jgi:hypothetical protein